MNDHAQLSPGGCTLVVSVPLSIRQRGGRKQVVASDGASAWAPPRAEIDSTLVKALARAFRWRRILEDGIYSTIDEIAAAERINPSYVGRVLRLTLLAPAIVEAILDGRQPSGITLNALMRPFSPEWGQQASVCRRDGD